MATCIYMKKNEMKESHIALTSLSNQLPTQRRKASKKREISNVRT